MLTSIWAESRNRVIGKSGSIPWSVPGDLEHFKQTTLGSTVVMGRRTFESLPSPLPGRKNIVLSRSLSDSDGVVTASSISEAIRLRGNGDVFFIGGLEVYREAMSLVDRLIVTTIDILIPGSNVVYAPVIPPSSFRRIDSLSDSEYRPRSGDAAYKVSVLERTG